MILTASFKAIVADLAVRHAAVIGIFVMTDGMTVEIGGTIDATTDMMTEEIDATTAGMTAEIGGTIDAMTDGMTAETEEMTTGLGDNHESSAL